eukprot:659459-Pelagomonas_calceolata.AAC.6
MCQRPARVLLVSLDFPPVSCQHADEHAFNFPPVSCLHADEHFASSFPPVSCLHSDEHFASDFPPLPCLYADEHALTVAFWLTGFVKGRTL